MDKNTKIIKLHIIGGKAAPAPPVGPVLGQAGINIGEFVRQFNNATQDRLGEVVPIVITVYKDRSFSFITKTSPASRLILKALNIKSGSGKNLVKKVGKLSDEDLVKITEEKMIDLNNKDLASAKKIIAGTARSMGVEITN